MKLAAQAKNIKKSKPKAARCNHKSGTGQSNPKAKIANKIKLKSKTTSTSPPPQNEYNRVYKNNPRRKRLEAELVQKGKTLALCDRAVMSVRCCRHLR